MRWPLFSTTARHQSVTHPFLEKMLYVVPQNSLPFWDFLLIHLNRNSNMLISLGFKEETTQIHVKRKLEAFNHLHLISNNAQYTLA